MEGVARLRDIDQKQKVYEENYSFNEFHDDIFDLKTSYIPDHDILCRFSLSTFQHIWKAERFKR